MVQMMSLFTEWYQDHELWMMQEVDQFISDNADATRSINGQKCSTPVLSPTSADMRI